MLNEGHGEAETDHTLLSRADVPVEGVMAVPSSIEADVAWELFQLDGQLSVAALQALSGALSTAARRSLAQDLIALGHRLEHQAPTVDVHGAEPAGRATPQRAGVRQGVVDHLRGLVAMCNRGMLAALATDLAPTDAAALLAGLHAFAASLTDSVADNLHACNTTPPILTAPNPHQTRTRAGSTHLPGPEPIPEPSPCLAADTPPERPNG